MENLDWKVRVYIGEKEIASWIIKNRTENEAYSEAAADVQKLSGPLSDEEYEQLDWSLMPTGKIKENKIKLTKEDIQKYGTEDEKKILEGYMTPAQREGVIDSFTFDDCHVRLFGRKDSEGLTIYDIQISGLYPDEAATVYCTDERSATETFVKLKEVLSKA